MTSGVFLVSVKSILINVIDGVVHSIVDGIPLPHLNGYTGIVIFCGYYEDESSHSPLLNAIEKQMDVHELLEFLGDIDSPIRKEPFDLVMHIKSVFGEEKFKVVFGCKQDGQVQYIFVQTELDSVRMDGPLPYCRTLNLRNDDDF